MAAAPVPPALVPVGDSDSLGSASTAAVAPLKDSVGPDPSSSHLGGPERIPVAARRVSTRVIANPMTVTLKDLSVEVERSKGMVGDIVKKLGFGKKAKVTVEPQNGKTDGVEMVPVPDGEAAASEVPDVLRLVKNVNAVLPAGKVTAIMGASGAGKTTLLNAIASRLVGSARAVGSIYFNDVDIVPLQKKGRGKRASYVKQEDTLLPYLTVRETLRFNAELRLPNSMSSASKHALVEEVILELNLKECADTMVGSGSSTSSSSRGCSSGERRLVSIAIQLLSSPPLLLLDEPTSSLDSFTSYALCQTLKNIANDGRTVILSVHQPRYSSFELFDHLILLCKGGHLVYNGPANEVRAYFEGLLGVEMNHEDNVADWILDVSSVDYSSPRKEKESKERLEMLAAAWKGRAQKEVVAPLPKGSPADPSAGAANAFSRFFTELSTLTRRGYKNTLRDRGSLFGVFGETLFFALVMGWIFFQLPNDLASIRSRQTLFVMSITANNYLLMILYLWLLSRDVELFDSDKVEGIAGVPSYVFSRFLSYFPFLVICPIIFCCIVYFMAGLREGQFGWYLGSVMVSNWGYWSQAFLCVGIARRFDAASLMANSLSIIPSFATGFNMAISTIPVWLGWTKYLVTTYYAYSTVYVSQFRDATLDCPYPAGDPRCAAYEGNNIIQQSGFDPNMNLGAQLGFALCSVVGFVIFGSLALAFITKEPVTAGAVASESHAVRFEEDLEEADGSAAADGQVVIKVQQPADLGHRTLAEEHQIHVMADNLVMDVETIGITLKTQKKRILANISMMFEPFKVTVIMGSGGSGKTSVLNAICSVKPGQSLASQTKKAGNVSFGTVVNPSTGVVVKYASYVRKETDNLYPALTVRETLNFSAHLRLYKMTEAERRARVESVIRTLGLSDCADTLVGDANLKGISGGEMRRVCIALGILEEEVAVLCLDEPSTGLDSSAATTVITALRRIADTGRTVILTSQQTSRPEAFNQFDNVLLLSRGGEVAYAGPREQMVPFFEKLGYKIPEFVQPADYVIDLSSIDLRNHAAETESRARVAGIVEQYKLTAAESFRAEAEKAPAAGEAPHQVEKAEIKSRTPFWQAIPVLFARTMRNFRRKPAEAIDFLALPGGFAFVSLVFYENSIRVSNYYSIQNTLGLLFSIPGLLFMGLLQTAAYYPPDRAFFTREFLDGITSVESFVATQAIVQVPFTIMGALIWVLLGCTALGLQIGFGVNFLINLLVTTCFLVVGTSIGLSILTVVDNIGLGLVVASALNTCAIVMSGVGAQSIPAVLYYINYISPLRWGIAVLTNLEFTGRTFSCTSAPDQSLPDGTCIVSTGEQVLQTLNLESVNIGMNLGILVAITVASRFIYYGLLKFKMSRMIS
ncbi:P-loop containing nucleoside triphosphate hydrolase protein [Hyaloraphidium curvatum]|nr:P-loop containing nucleoside triphosphate hydrolase protein [Hyaloraphidium curvatum]